MPLSFRILPDRGLAYIRYDGHAGVDETLAALKAYATHPDFSPGQKQLVDLSHVTDFDRDYVRVIALQARTADVFLQGDQQTLLVFYAPTAISRSMAQTAVRSWETLGGVIPIVQQHEYEALQILGQPETSISALLAATAPSAEYRSVK